MHADSGINNLFNITNFVISGLDCIHIPTGGGGGLGWVTLWCLTSVLSEE